MHNERWLHTLAGRLADSTGTLGPDALALIDAVALHRERWNIDHVDPLGLAATGRQHADEREALAAEIDARGRSVSSRAGTTVDDIALGD